MLHLFVGFKYQMVGHDEGGDMGVSIPWLVRLDAWIPTIVTCPMDREIQSRHRHEL